MTGGMHGRGHVWHTCQGTCDTGHGWSAWHWGMQGKGGMCGGGAYMAGETATGMHSYVETYIRRKNPYSIAANGCIGWMKSWDPKSMDFPVYVCPSHNHNPKSNPNPNRILFREKTVGGQKNC